jgi:hypothetical protein
VKYKLHHTENSIGKIRGVRSWRPETGQQPAENSLRQRSEYVITSLHLYGGVPSRLKTTFQFNVTID